MRRSSAVPDRARGRDGRGRAAVAGDDAVQRRPDRFAIPPAGTRHEPSSPGPAAGVMGASLWARTEQITNALTFDMGGTSCDVALIAHGTGPAPGTEINGHPLHLPMLDIQTVSAGGGSIAWADSGGALRVGPRSAGARPGPAAYGLGGYCTDGHRCPGCPRAGDGGRHPRSADAAARRPGQRGRGCARRRPRAQPHGLRRGHRRRSSTMRWHRAVRVVSVERGVHPGGATPIAFGGAGPFTPARSRTCSGIERVIAPACAGVLAALGTLIAGERRDPGSDRPYADRRCDRTRRGPRPAARPGPAAISRRGTRVAADCPLRRSVARPDGGLARARTPACWPSSSGTAHTVLRRCRPGCA